MKSRSLTRKDYEDCRSASNGMGEARDCAVVATALACRVPYGVAHEALERCGRERGRGTAFDITTAACESLGFRVEELRDNRQEGGSRFTPRTIGGRLEEGYWLCRVSHHVFAVVNGKVLDHHEGRTTRINKIYRVVKDGRKA